MPTPRTGAGGPGRRGRTGEGPGLVEPTACATDTNVDSSGSSVGGGGGGAKTGGIISRLPAIREKRTSVNRKTRTTSVNDATTDNSTTTTTTTNITTTTLQRQESSTSSTSPTPTRRASVPQYPTSQSPPSQKGSKPTFAGIGRRVSHMVRARMAFQSRRRSGASGEEANPMERIHELPRKPRFTAFLSPEAQYAVMQGYEDKLYEKIAGTNPESRLVLRRTKTPFHKKISIVGEDGGEGGGRKAAPFPDNHGVTTITPSTTTTTTTTTPPTITTTPVTPELDNRDTSENGPGNALATSTPLPNPPVTSTPLPNPPLPKPARSQTHVYSDVSKSMTSPSPRGSGGVGWALHRSSSLPMLNSGLSHQRRLVLTYRLESAMDILDTLKARNKENSLSPRVPRRPRPVDAVRDFNCWTKVWSKEFKLAHAK